MTGVVVENNEALSDEPGLINTAAESDGWFIKIDMANPDDVSDLMDGSAYAKHCEDEAH